jgi:hypothetical protein
MKHAALVALVAIGLGSCAAAQKHPGITVGLVAGTIGFGACEIAVEKLGTCSAIGGVAGLVLGGITGLAMLFAREEDHSLPPFTEEEDEGVVRTRTEPPPGLPPGMTPALDAGVPSAFDAGVLADAAP